MGHSHPNHHSCDSPWRCWKMKLGSLQEQQVLKLLIHLFSLLYPVWQSLIMLPWLAPVYRPVCLWTLCMCTVNVCLCECVYTLFIYLFFLRQGLSQNWSSLTELDWSQWTPVLALRMLTATPDFFFFTWMLEIQTQILILEWRELYQTSHVSLYS